MILFPFSTAYLKTSKPRKKIEADLISQTFLSDASYQKTDKQKKLFYGRVNDQGFTLQNVAHDKLVPFIEGYILGVDTEMFVKFRFKGFRSMRIFLLLTLLIVGSLSFVGSHLWKRGLNNITDIPVLVALVVTLFLLFIILNTGRAYYKKLKETKDFFRGLLMAEQVDKGEVPGIFR